LIIPRCSSQLRSATALITIARKAVTFVRKYTHQDTNEISGKSVQAKDVYISATDNVFLAFTMVRQIMTELSGAATEREMLLP
jgi:hypothetical protein